MSDDQHHQPEDPMICIKVGMFFVLILILLCILAS